MGIQLWWISIGYYLSGLHNGLCNGIFMDILEKSSKTGEISWGYTLKNTPNLIWFLGVSENEIYPWNGHFVGNMMNRRILIGVSFFAKNLSSHNPTYWFQIVKKGDWLVLGVVEPGPWLAVPTVWSHHVYLSLFRDGCDSDTWPIWIRVGPKFCARLLQLPGIFRMWCWSPVSATAMVLSTLPESKTQMAQPRSGWNVEQQVNLCHGWGWDWEHVGDAHGTGGLQRNRAESMEKCPLADKREENYSIICENQKLTFWQPPNR